MKHLRWLLLITLLLAACGPANGAPTPSGPRTLTVMTHDSFDMSEDLLRGFEQEHNVTVQILKSGDTGEALGKAILAKGQPLADVFYGVDNTFLSRALEEEIFDPYAAPALAAIPDEFKLDPANGALPVDFGDVCVNYDKRYFTANNVPPPAALEDLTQPAYRDLLVVENPATSSPGLAFLFATIGHFGEDGYLDYWQALRDNGVLVVNDWETAYYSEFSGASGAGPRPLVVSYSSSPPFELIFAETPPAEPSTAALVENTSCFRQIEFVGILAGAANRDLAERWVDFMLARPFQENLPLTMFVFPVHPEAELDPTFESFMGLPEQTAQVSPADIAAHREEWIEAWTNVVLR